MLVISDEINKTEDMTLNSRLLNNVILLTSSIQLNCVVNRNDFWLMPDSICVCPLSVVKWLRIRMLHCTEWNVIFWCYHPQIMSRIMNNEIE